MDAIQHSHRDFYAHAMIHPFPWMTQPDELEQVLEHALPLGALDSKTVHAIDFREDEAIDEAALRALIREAVKVNTTK